MPTATPSPCVHSRVSFVSTRTTRAGSFEMIWREIEIDARRASTVTARARRRANETREWRLTLISAPCEQMKRARSTVVQRSGWGRACAL